MASVSTLVSVVQPNGPQFSTSVTTAGCSTKSDCMATEMIGNVMNSSMARMEGKMNAKKVRCGIGAIQFEEGRSRRAG